MGGFCFPKLKLYYKATVIQTVWYWNKDRLLDQWNRIENPEIVLQIHEELIFNKREKY